MLWKSLCTVLLLLSLVLVWKILFGPTGYPGYTEMEQRLTAARADLAQAEEENLRLSREIRRLKSDPAFAADFARVRLHLAAPDERIYIFPHP